MGSNDGGSGVGDGGGAAAGGSGRPGVIGSVTGGARQSSRCQTTGWNSAVRIALFWPRAREKDRGTRTDKGTLARRFLGPRSSFGF